MAAQEGLIRAKTAAQGTLSRYRHANGNAAGFSATEEAFEPGANPEVGKGAIAVEVEDRTHTWPSRTWDTIANGVAGC